MMAVVKNASQISVTVVINGKYISQQTGRKIDFCLLHTCEPMCVTSCQERVNHPW